MHLSSFQRYLLLQALASTLHFYLHVSCNFLYIASFALDIRLNSLRFMFLTTSGIHILEYGSYSFNVIATTTTFTYFNTVRIK